MKTVVKSTSNTGAVNSMSPAKAMNTTKAISTEKAIRATKAVSATKAMNTTKAISTEKAIRATKAMSPAKAMNKKPDQTVESNKKQAYHLIMRGDDKRRIFWYDKDYKKFLSLLNGLMQRFDAVLYAFTLMTNHIHLLIKITDIELFTEYLTKAYTGYFYYRYKIPGRLFEPSLFYPKNSVYLKMNIIIYILNNPALANISTQPWTYKYNSYLFYTDAYNELAKYIKVEPSIIKKNFSTLDSFKDLLRSKIVVERAEKRFKYMEDEW